MVSTIAKGKDSPDPDHTNSFLDFQIASVNTRQPAAAISVVEKRELSATASLDRKPSNSPWGPPRVKNLPRSRNIGVGESNRSSERNWPPISIGSRNGRTRAGRVVNSHEDWAVIPKTECPSLVSIALTRGMRQARCGVATDFPGGPCRSEPAQPNRICNSRMCKKRRFKKSS